MTSFMMPRVHGQLLPDNLKLNHTNSPIINYTLATYLATITKASDQYSETWDAITKKTNMYENLGDKPKCYYETQEILSVFKLFADHTHIIFNEKQMVEIVFKCILNSKKTYNSIIKIGTLFTQIDVDCIYILSLCFNEVYIYKPAASSAVLTDKYVVCKDFKLYNTDSLKSIFNQILCELKMIQNIEHFSLYTKQISSNYINTLVEANSVIGQQQLEAMNNTITLIEQGNKKEKIEALKKQQAIKCAEWIKKFGVSNVMYKQYGVV